MSAEYQARLATYRSARRVALGIRLTRREQMAHRRERAQTEHERVPNSPSKRLFGDTLMCIVQFAMYEQHVVGCMKQLPRI